MVYCNTSQLAIVSIFVVFNFFQGDEEEKQNVNFQVAGHALILTIFEPASLMKE